MQNKLEKIHDKVRQSGVSPGCWIDGAIPRSSVEIIDKLEELLALIDPEYDSSESRNCYLCSKRGYLREIAYRKERNKSLGLFALFKLPKWEDLRVYDKIED